MSINVMKICDFISIGRLDLFISHIIDNEHTWNQEEKMVFLRSCIVHDEISTFQLLTQQFNIDIKLSLSDFFKTACTSDSIKSLNYFFESFNVSPSTGDGFEWAVCQNQLKTVKFLVEKGADINSDKSLALIISVREGHDKITEYFLSQNVFINEKQIIEDEVISQKTKKYLLSFKEKIDLANKLNEQLPNNINDSLKLKI